MATDPFTSMTDDEAGELVLSRLSGEDDPHYYARITRIACNHWLLGTDHLKYARLNGSNREVIRKLESYERKSKHTLTTYSELLYEALHPKAAA